MTEKKHVIVMSGVSGSGKTSYAKNLALGAKNAGALAAIVSADDYFMVRDPENYGVVKLPVQYKFDASKLSEAHAICFRLFMSHLQSGEAYRPSESITRLIVVDNTNLSAHEIAPYMLAAAAYGYEAEIITMPRPDSFEQFQAHADRCVHGLKAQDIHSQSIKLFHRTLPAYWKHTQEV